LHCEEPEKHRALDALGCILAGLYDKPELAEPLASCWRTRSLSSPVFRSTVEILCSAARTFAMNGSTHSGGRTFRGK
jgi:hypothetical protein